MYTQILAMITSYRTSGCLLCVVSWPLDWVGQAVSELWIENDKWQTRERW